MPDRYVLDAFALLAFFNEEAGAQQVANIVEEPRHALHISAINLGEVYYRLIRQRGRVAAEASLGAVFAQPNLEVSQASWDRVRAAAEVKAGGRLSYADAFAAALSRELSAPLVTGDLEFAPLEAQGLLTILWLPR